ncbi:putative serine/threonine-protein kinase 10, partial [Apostichopus japonicus]
MVRWSKQFSDFIAKCLDKNVETRPTAQELLRHPWLADAEDNKPIKQLLLEAKADVEVEEEDLPEDQLPQDDKSSLGSFDQLPNHEPSVPVTPATRSLQPLLILISQMFITSTRRSLLSPGDH